ncbi:ATP-dependent DNA helicase PIF1 [Gracilaria domingensis]|nr:ATP-dependent DNA helicase PIF1 [Gracilaria domingensis]
MEAFMSGKSIALLGCAGSGNSLLVQSMLQYASKHIGEYPVVVVCAHTHQASIPIGGRTVSSVFGIHANWALTKEKLLEEIKKDKWRMSEIRQVRVLIIEEVLLLNSETLDAIDAILRYLTRNDGDCALPFGGRQVVLSGDIFQLGPVEQIESLPSENRYAHLSRPLSLTFGGFGTGIVSMLSTNHRKQNDKQFFSIFQRIGRGKVADDDVNRINGTSKGILKPTRSHTKLFLYRSQVSEYNDWILGRLSGKLYDCIARDMYVPMCSRSQVSRQMLKERLQNAAPDVVSVKIGGAVLLTRKSGAFLPGEKLIISEVQLGPSGYVQYLKCRVEDGYDEHILRKEKFSIRAMDASILASRVQFPIIPAYGVNIHKCQGLTLQNVAVDFIPSRWKPNGMVYVALSRCKSLRGLWVKGLTKEHIQYSNAAEDYMKYIEKLKKHYPGTVISESES